MGKKSKRRGGNRNQTNQTQTRGISTANTKDEFERIERAVKSLNDESDALFRNSLLSQARAKLSKIAALLEADKDLLQKNHPDYYRSTNVCNYDKIAIMEFKRRNFQAVISAFHSCKSFDMTTDNFYVLYCLALLVTRKMDTYQSFNAALEYVQSSNYHMTLLGPCWHMFLTELRRMRKWDEALDFTHKIGRYIEECKLLFVGLDFLYVATYIERYRIEARKRPSDKRNKMSVPLYKYISVKLTDGFEKVETGGVGAHPYLRLIFAQWLYLNHQGTTEQRAKERDTAIFLVEKYIETQYEDKVTSFCLVCAQKPTSLGEGLTCSSCRVACYCSLDHQRSSWKKELHWGVGIGHKLLCPLYKAYRKYKNAWKSHGKNMDEYHTRFRRECEKFLSDGLGLRDLCFSRDFVDKNGEEFRFAKWRTVIFK